MTETVERPATLRQTLLARHDKCPYSAMLAMKYEGSSDSHAAARGTAFHQVAERAITEMVQREEASMPGDVCRTIAEEVLRERTDLVMSAAEQDVVRLCAYNFGEGYVVDPGAVVGVEVPLQMELGGFTLTGTVDLIEAHGSTLHIRDFKTSLAIKKREEVARGFQGKMYALLCLFGTHRDTGLSLGAGITDVNFAEVYPRYRDKESGQLIQKDAFWNKAEVYEFRGSVERNVGQFAEQLESGEWPARDGSWCDTCACQPECPIPAKLRELPEITTEAEAEEAFSHKLALERESRRVQKGLRGYVQATGQPIRVGDLAFDAQVIESRAVKDWDAMTYALYQTSEFGSPFEVTDHVEIRTSTKYAKRKATEEELDG